MFAWFQRELPSDPKALLEVFGSARNGQAERALERFKSLDFLVRAKMVQEVAYHPVSEGMAKLMGYAMKHDPDGYVRSVAKKVTDARPSLRVQAEQFTFQSEA